MIKLILFLFGVLMIICGILLNKNQNKNQKLDKRDIAIDTIARLWKTHKTEIEIEKLVNLWAHNPKSLIVEQKEKNIVVFEHEEIDSFYNLYIQDSVDEQVEQICIELLKLLDEKGDISSVVRHNNDSNNELPDNMFKLLAEVPLYEHTIRVAEEIIKLTKQTPFTMNKAIIAALGHDIGKIFAKDEYTKFDHPALSATYLEKNIAAFSGYNFRNEVIQAVRGHHKSDVFNILTDLLKKADKKAREIEVSIYKDKKVDADETKKEPIIIKFDDAKKHIVKDDDKANEETKKEEFKKTVLEKAESFETKSWIDGLDDRAVLTNLADAINRLDDTGRFQAVSMKNGLVYVRPEYVLELIKPYVPEKFNLSDEEDRRTVLITVANYFIDKGYIDTKYMKKNFFSAPFVILLENGKELKGFYMTFNVEAFSAFGTLSIFESRKEDWLKNIVSIKRKYAMGSDEEGK
jgi:hypothetical protein